MLLKAPMVELHCSTGKVWQAAKVGRPDVSSLTERAVTGSEKSLSLQPPLPCLMVPKGVARADGLQVVLAERELWRVVTGPHRSVPMQPALLYRLATQGVAKGHGLQLILTDHERERSHGVCGGKSARLAARLG